jgi:hypothetical protein
MMPNTRCSSDFDLLGGDFLWRFSHTYRGHCLRDMQLAVDPY